MFSLSPRTSGCMHVHALAHMHARTHTHSYKICVYDFNIHAYGYSVPHLLPWNRGRKLVFMWSLSFYFTLLTKVVYFSDLILHKLSESLTGFF